MSKYKAGDEIIWTEEHAYILPNTKTAIIDKIEDGQYFYTFIGGTKFQYPIIELDDYDGVRVVTPLEKML